MQPENKTGFSLLAGHSTIALTTFRENGQPVTTPVWFAQDGDKLYVMSLATAAEVQRIHQNAQVEVAPCAENGVALTPSIEAMALPLSGHQAEIARRALNHKYGLRGRLYDLIFSVKRQERVYLEITPM